MNDSWFVFATLGEMKLNDILSECQKQGWVPILVARQNDNVIVPCFPTQKIALEFAKRNLPKNQLFGTTILTEDDISKLQTDWIEIKGWKVEMLNHANLMKNNYKIDVEVFEFHDNPDVYGVWGKSCETKAICFDLK